MKQVNSLSLAKIAKPQPEEQSYQAKLRHAIYDGIKESDVAEIVQGIVKRAKNGDEKAVKQFFEYVLGSGVKQATQNNVYVSAPAASEPTSAKPRTAGKIEVMRLRAERGEELFHEKDTGVGE